MSWHFYIFPVIFMISGVFHLVKPKAFMRIMPLYLPYHKEIVYISGVIEIVVAIGLLLTRFRDLSLLAAMVLLLLFFPVHIHMLINRKASLNLPKSVLLFRLLLQFFMIYWLSTYIS
ncbi:DoxX family protein [Aquimarina brevivitae]|uniref:Putative membrane protein n=1 Tax=Aquimarina brevivitae TaxID=323412 RepID=A0A4Q7P024_9FLAO|nr:DoxX family protein [Aquimarina brevivitae]RZS93116.1 putative membrane protein [Aquimarina brevivitae]